MFILGKHCFILSHPNMNLQQIIYKFYICMTMNKLFAMVFCESYTDDEVLLARFATIRFEKHTLYK